jgi:F subunit of K+-transporting ATPase (Potass_KdpF)
MRLAAPFAALTPADVFGLVVSFLVCLYLVYALLRGEKL